MTNEEVISEIKHVVEEECMKHIYDFSKVETDVPLGNVKVQTYDIYLDPKEDKPCMN